MTSSETSRPALVSDRILHAAAVACSALAALLAPGQVASVSSHSAEELVGRLLSPAERSLSEAARFGPDCGSEMAEVMENRGIASELVGMGESARPAIESGLSVIEQKGFGGTYAREYLLFAYAKILGQGAYPRLVRMLSNPRINPNEHMPLDIAIALSRGLTSWVDSSDLLTGERFCFPSEPRDALDAMINAWEKGDLKLLEDSLGSDAQSSLNLMIKGQSWTSVRGSFGQVQRRNTALGYRFQISEPLSVPVEALDHIVASSQERAVAQRLRSGVTIRTAFERGTGSSCGAFAVSFGTADSQLPGRKKFVVNNRDLHDLLGLVNSCLSPL